MVISPHALGVQSQTVEWIWDRSPAPLGKDRVGIHAGQCVTPAPCTFLPAWPRSSLPPGACCQGSWMHLHHTSCPAPSPAPTHISKDGTHLTHWAFPPAPRTMPLSTGVSYSWLLPQAPSPQATIHTLCGASSPSGEAVSLEASRSQACLIFCLFLTGSSGLPHL